MRTQNLSWKGVTKGNCRDPIWKGCVTAVRTLSWEAEASGNSSIKQEAAQNGWLSWVALSLPQQENVLWFCPRWLTSCYIQVLPGLLASGRFYQCGPLAEMGGMCWLCLVTQSCLPPWTVAHQAPLSLGILQARILDWVAMPSSRGSSPPRDWTQVSRIAGRFFTNVSHQENSRILEWVAYPFSRATSWPRNWTRVSCTASRFFICLATREVWWEGYGAITLRLTLGSPPVRIPKVTAPLKGSCLQKFPGGPVVRTFFFFTAKSLGLTSGWGTKISHVVWYGQINK